MSNTGIIDRKKKFWVLIMATHCEWHGKNALSIEYNNEQLREYKFPENISVLVSITWRNNMDAIKFDLFLICKPNIPTFINADFPCRNSFAVLLKHLEWIGGEMNTAWVHIYLYLIAGRTLLRDGFWCHKSWYNIGRLQMLMLGIELRKNSKFQNFKWF